MEGQEQERDPEADRRYLALLREQDWGQLAVDLVLHGTRDKHLSPDLAEQIAADTIARACDPRRSPWDPSRGAKLFTHLSWVYDSELEHFRAKRKRRKTNPMAEEDLPEPPPDSDGDPDVRAERSENLGALRDKLEAAVARRPLAQKLLALEEKEQISDVDEQVERTGATRAQVYEARRFLAETARALLADEGHHLSRERRAAERDASKEEETP